MDKRDNKQRGHRKEDHHRSHLDRQPERDDSEEIREDVRKRRDKSGKQSRESGKDRDRKRETAYKEKTNFYKSPNLSEDVVVNYTEPPEARKPNRRWRLYIFKDDERLPFIPMHQKSAYLFGRDRRIADIPIDNLSCSKQHAVCQYRLIDYMRLDGTSARRISPYIMDLDSSNGTYVNNSMVEPQQYHELFERDVINFGYSSRDYVLLRDTSDASQVFDEETA